MKHFALPPAQGLYDPAYEHDACGMGFVAHLKGEKSAQIVQQALKVLTHMEHRGACGCEENTGDGAGIMLQLPHKFLLKECAKLGINLPKAGDYAVGFAYLPQDDGMRADAISTFEGFVRQGGQTLLGWRDIPTNPDPIGNTAKSMPLMRMAFIQRSADVARGIDFERKLYLIRKQTSSAILYRDNPLYLFCQPVGAYHHL
ncbi:MAG: hypothetical protein R3E95_00895 [Thiolinea sp.]